MSTITITLKLKKHVIDAGRYEEYIYVHNKCYSLFKDGSSNYVVSIDGGTFVQYGIQRKKDALKILVNHIVAP